MRYHAGRFDEYVQELRQGKTVWAILTETQERARFILPALRNCPPRSKYRSKLDKKWIWKHANFKACLLSADMHLTWAEYRYRDGTKIRFSVIGLDEKGVLARLLSLRRETKPGKS